MTEHKLSKRLAAIAAMVPAGARVADIGTDHGYLSIYLKSSGKAESVIACDIKKGPLDTAAENIRKSGVDGIELRLGDGLKPLAPGEADTVIIAGMGGEITASIIAAAPWVAKRRVRLLLQPMTSAEDLRLYLSESGFAIENEIAVSDAGRIYAIINAVFSGIPGCYSKSGIYIGNMKLGTADEKNYALRQYRRLRKLCASIDGVAERSEYRRQVCRAVEEIEKIFEKAGVVYD